MLHSKEEITHTQNIAWMKENLYLEIYFKNAVNFYTIEVLIK